MPISANDFNPKYRQQIERQLQRPKRTSPVASGIQNPEPQPNPEQALGATPSGKKTGAKRVEVCITRYGYKPLDADNAMGGIKFLVDRLRYENLISDDDPYSIDLVFKQVEVETRKEEGTLIRLRELPEISL